MISYNKGDDTVKRLIFIILLLCISFGGCTGYFKEASGARSIQQQVNLHVEQSTENTDRTYFTEKDADMQLKGIYSLFHLDNHEVYMDGDEMNINLYFNGEVERKEIENSRTFIMKIFVLRATSRYGTPIPYQQLILSKLNWDKAISRIFIDDVKVLEEEHKAPIMGYQGCYI